MIWYVPSSAAEALSHALWALTRPPQVRTPKDTTCMFGWVDDVNGDRWLEVDSEYETSVHPEAELGGIADILQPWIDAGYLPSGVNADLTAYVESKRGGRMTPWEAFPQLFKERSKSHQDMIDAGLLAGQPEVMTA